MTLLEIADKFPPCLCRLLARKNHGHAPLSVRELAEKTGLSKSTIAELSLRRTWSGVSIDTVVKFSQACGVDLFRPRDTVAYLRRSKRAHLKNADAQQKKFFLRLCQAKKKSV